MVLNGTAISRATDDAVKPGILAKNGQFLAIQWISCGRGPLEDRVLAWFKVAGYQLMIFMTLASSFTVLAMGICAGSVSVHS